MKSVGEVEVPQPVGVVKPLRVDPIGEQRMESIKEKFDEFLQGVFKEGELVEVRIKPFSHYLLEVTTYVVKRRSES